MNPLDVMPSPETIRDVAEVLKYAAMLDPRLSHADKATIAAWSKQVERHPGLTREDLVNGLQRFYDSASERPIGIGDLITHSRLCKHDRIEKEDAEIREIRREEQDAKAGEEVQAVAAAFVAGPVKNRTQRLFEAEHALQRCHGKRECSEAIREYFAAKAEAKKPRLREAS